MQWLRRSFVTGFFVTVPLFISVAAFIWIFNVVDGLTTPLYDRLLGHRIPGLGTVTTAIVIVLVGALARNVMGVLRVISLLRFGSIDSRSTAQRSNHATRSPQTENLVVVR